MKICLLGYHEKYFWTGSATLKVQKNVHRHLNLRSIKTDLFVSSGKKNLISVLFDPLKLELSSEGRILSGGVIPFLWHLYKENYDIIHMILTRNYMVIVALFTSIMGFKNFVTFHDNLIFPELPNIDIKNLKLFITKWVLFNTSNGVFIYNGSDLKKFGIKYPDKQIFVIKNGVEEFFFDSRNNGSNRVNILFSGGRNKPHKGYQFLLNSLNKTKENYRLVICGEGEVQALSESNLGELTPKQFREILKDIVALIIPSGYEAFSITALEAMACSTPIIISNKCGLIKYLNDGKGCFIVNYGDEEGLAQRIDLLIRDTFLWQKMSTEARDIAKHFVWSRIIEDYEKHYRSLENK
ncbi:MAG: hypothetical protein A2315_02915 [Ignavibacteria bacterium RIFOXYB2_FULL_35_12]|nr:MAG: hypothetical protein A2058_11225 [Ignavibacteria bacterium GWA2_36_19]OGU61098.1 MAG: hypothetical protein A2X60_16980 [Ignavibacteria bacterium GWF2_35_20]OGU80847.1 MAG: hypothetical protein A2254_06385 [Ignavibacteria bacterium RIFOXYA2_FULL_35_9]OGU84879.1 MAG: hypothetical protein A3K31_16800 [Ignavibacteria bacterium RIFOXYA12_FULL_35_25]OGU92738.1 MAG: hypothetical protein A2492_11650 [Ignavibacteria bacterium RIFOXYC12_FULL_35_11]OGU93745.1 MAG: hypothetical protein A2347_02240